MRWLAILAILGYRMLIRPFHRRICLYEESCSSHAIRLLRERGLGAALPAIRARVRSCRMPAGACFVVDRDGTARLLSWTSHTGAAVPPAALALLALEAEQVARPREAD